MFFNLLGATGLPVWVTNSFPIARQVLMVFVFICAIALIVVTMIQPGETSGSNVITGGSESYYSKNKASSREGRFKRLTIVLSILMAVAIVIYCILTTIYGGK